MSRMLEQAKKAAAANRAPLAGGGLQKAGDAGIDPAEVVPAAPAPAKKSAAASKDSARRPAKQAAEDDSVRKPFGSYLPKGVHRRFKATCVLREIEIQDALEEAVEAWIDPSPRVRLPKEVARQFEAAVEAADVDPAWAVREALAQWAEGKGVREK